MKKLNLLIADDHAILRESLLNSLLHHPSIESIETVENGQQLLDACNIKLPELILLDINMPVIDGLGACKAIKKLYPSVKVVFLTMHNNPQYFYEAKAVNCDGYIFKTAGLDEIIKSIHKIQAGEKYFSPAVVDALLSNTGNDKNGKPNLTEREHEVLKLILDEFSNKEIAEKLIISQRTVDAHKRNLLAKTNSRNITGLIKFALTERIL